MSAEPPSADEAGHRATKRTPRAPSHHFGQTQRAIDETSASQAFFKRLMRWFLPRTKQADTGSVVEKLVLLFSKLAVAISTIGLLVGGWISMERYQARMAAKANAGAAAHQGEQTDEAAQQPQQRQSTPDSTATTDSAEAAKTPSKDASR